MAVVSPGGHVRTLATPLSDAAMDAVQPQEDVVRFANHWSLVQLQDQWQSGAGTVEYTMQLASLPALSWWQTTPDALDL